MDTPEKNCRSSNPPENEPTQKRINNDFKN